MSSFIFVVCTSILLLIFGPKVVAVRKKKKKNKTETPNRQWGLTANNKANNREENKANSIDIEGNSTVSDSSSGIKIMGINKSTTLRNENEVMRRENEELKRLLEEANVKIKEMSDNTVPINDDAYDDSDVAKHLNSEDNENDSGH